MAASMAFLALRPHQENGKPPDPRFSTAMALPAAGPSPLLPGIRFSWAGDFSEGMAPVRVAAKYGFIDTAGTLRVQPRFDYTGGFSENRAPALTGGKWGYLDVTGREAIPAVYAYAGAFREGLAPVATEEGYGFIDSNGVPVGDMGYSDARPYSEGLAAVRVGFDDYSAWGFVDRRGELVIPPLFTDVPGGFSEGFAVVRMESEMPYRSGFIDSSGGFAIDTLFDAAGDFHEGLAPVGRGDWRGNRFEGDWGYVDTTGRLVTPLAYAWAGPFRNGTALVRLKGGGNAWIGRNGRVLRSFRADLEVTRGSEGDLVTYKLRNLCGFVDSLGQEPTEPIFAEAGTFSQGWARVRLITAGSRNWAYIDKHGRYLGGSTNGTDD
ncbi:MAG: hypothetical protein JWO30_3807 [Fibrobacteres bacterium]|nr:hypothetical protein [Fibrobacterota bacterium]